MAQYICRQIWYSMNSMNFGKKTKKQNENNSTVTKAEVLAGLQMVCANFERNNQKNLLFMPEYVVSKAINSILEQRDNFTKADVIEVLNLFNDIDKVEHYDGSGWFDYQIRLAYFLQLNGFKTETRERKLHLI